MMKIGGREFDTVCRAYVMGILNVTPDSFSDGGKYRSLDAALKRTQEMIEQGADLIDIGGESTRPGYTMVSQEEEISRVAPVIEAVKARFDIPISLDTYKADVARAGIAAGADLINDIWGLKYDPRMAAVIAAAGCPCCLMHNREKPDYQDFMPDVLRDLEESLALAAQAGIARENIIIDPGVGFGKTYENNLQVISAIDQLLCFGRPVLLGTSRKSVIGLTMEPEGQQRLEGTIATSVIGVMKGVSFVRVHDVKENVRAIRMAQAIRQST